MSHFTPTVYNRPKFPPEDAKYGGLERSPVLALSLPLKMAWYQEVTLNTQMHGSEAPQGGHGQSYLEAPYSVQGPATDLQSPRL